MTEQGKQRGAADAAPVVLARHRAARAAVLGEAEPRPVDVEAIRLAGIALRAADAWSRHAAAQPEGSAARGYDLDEARYYAAHAVHLLTKGGR